MSGVNPATEDQRKEASARAGTHDDELLECRRRPALLRVPIDFEAKRLERLVEEAIHAIGSPGPNPT